MVPLRYRQNEFLIEKRRNCLLERGGCLFDVDFCVRGRDNAPCGTHDVDAAVSQLPLVFEDQLGGHAIEPRRRIGK